MLNMGDWQRWLMHSTLNRDQAGSIPASPTRFAGLADMDMHSPFKRDEVGSIPTSRTRVTLVKRRHSITDECAELLPRGFTYKDESSRNLSAASNVGMWSNG
jgi:hypothetical protein